MKHDYFSVEVLLKIPTVVLAEATNHDEYMEILLSYLKTSHLRDILEVTQVSEEEYTVGRGLNMALEGPESLSDETSGLD